MATSKEYQEYIKGNLDEALGYVFCRPMMGGYLFYYNNILFGGLYGDRFLIKKTINNDKYNLKEEIPYENAKLMYLVNDDCDLLLLKDIVVTTCKDLELKK